MSDSFIPHPPLNEAPARFEAFEYTPSEPQDVPAPSPYQRGRELSTLDEHVTEKLAEDRDRVRRCLEDLYAEREMRSVLIARLEEVESRLDRALISTRGDDEPKAASAIADRPSTSAREFLG